MKPREIKFRAWDESNQILWNVSEIYWSSQEICIYSEDECEVVPWDEHIILLEYTGFRTENNKRIFQGDVLKVPTDLKVPLWEVVWNEEYAQFCLCGKDEDGDLREIDFSQIGYGQTGLEIYGNIYENPGLLQVA